MTDRLSLRTLPGALTAARAGGAPVTGPAVDPSSAEVGVVHLGVGAFHRAHQAVFTEDAAAATGEEGWGILGVTQRSARVVEQLRPQDGLYSVLTAGRDETSLRVIGSMRDVAFLAQESERVVDAIAAPTTHVVSSTVSEKGYRRAVGGGPDLQDPDVAADVEAVRTEASGRPADGPARTPVGVLCRALARRRREHGTPLTVVCCDNMADNGCVLHGLVDRVLAAAGADDVRAWVAESVRFPSTMVDRITPATTPGRRDEAAALLGLRDEALVVAEPFSQWVIEDDFAGPRPAWERAGAVLTADVAAWERAKLRMLNGTHSAIAYLGALAGHRMIDEAVLDPRIAAVAEQLQQEEVRRTLTPPDGLDLDAYGASILERFANPATGYTTLQVAGDGSQKLPFRIVGTIGDLLADGEVPHAATRTMAAWAVFVARGHDVDGAELPLDDPLADTLRATAAGDDAGLADRMLGLEQVFAEDVRGHDGFRAAFREQVAELLRTVR